MAYLLQYRLKLYIQCIFGFSNDKLNDSKKTNLIIIKILRKNNCKLYILIIQNF